MTHDKALKLLIISVLLAGMGGRVYSQEKPAEPKQENPYFTQFFTEKVFTVTREGDGILPGTLRTALIQASGARSNNSFTLVRIVFDPMVKRVRVTKGPLPEIDGSLTTVDCQTPSGRGIIEGAIEDTEGLDPGEEMAGLKIISTGNTVRNCHITGFTGPGILIRGTRNVIEYNTVGYHKDNPETAVPSSAVHEEPKTNRGPGILLGVGANANSVQNNEIVGNTFNGVELATGVGAGNKITYNYFAKNSGKPIKVVGPSLRAPQITQITRKGDVYLVNGSADPKAEVHLYLAGKDDAEVGMNIAQGIIPTAAGFQVATKSKGFIPGVTKIFAVSQLADGNTSEFSLPQAIPGLVQTQVTISAAPEHDPAPGKTETASEARAGNVHDGEENEAIEIDIPDGDSAPAAEEPRTAPSAPTEISSPSTPADPTKPAETETTLNVKGMGDKGGQPDSGAKAHEVSSLGI